MADKKKTTTAKSKAQKPVTPPAAPTISAHEAAGAVPPAAQEARTVSAVNPPNTSYFDELPNMDVYAAATPCRDTDPLSKLRRKVDDTQIVPSRGELVSTGILGLDLVMHGGLNFGSVHEFFGKSKGGKSLAMISTARAAQRKYPDCIVVILDRENAHEVERTRRFGLDMNRTIIIPPRRIPTPDHAYELIISTLHELDGIDMDNARAVKAKEAYEKTHFSRMYTDAAPHVVFIIDSIPAFAEKQAVVEDQGRRAKMWHGVLRRITGLLDARVMVLVSNHINHKPTMFGDGAVKSTGLAADYYRDCGVRCTAVHPIYNENDVHIGDMLEVTADKTRRGVSNAATRFAVYGGGVNFYSGVVFYAIYLGVAELANKTAYKDGKGKVFPKVRFNGYILDESSPTFKDDMLASGILDAIRAKVEELF